MRAADAIEKITKTHSSFINSHKAEIIELLRTAGDKELKWHAALLVSRLNLSGDEAEQTWNTLTNWARDKSESKIVRVNSLQALHNLSKVKKSLKKEFEIIIRDLKTENIPSINARIRLLIQD